MPRRPEETNDDSEEFSEEEDEKKKKKKKPKKNSKKKSKKQSKKEKKEKHSKKKKDEKNEESDEEEKSDKESEEEQSESGSDDSDEENDDESEESESEDESDESDHEDSKDRKRRKRKQKKKRKGSPSTPPLPISGNHYFLFMVVCQVFTIAFLFWAFWIESSGMNFAVMIALNCVVVALEIFGYRAVIYEKFKDFTSLWQDSKQPAERKMNSIITVTTTNTSLMFVMFLVQAVTVITIFFAIPSIVLDAEVWSFVSQMTAGNKVIFSLLIVCASFTIYAVWCLTYALLFAVNRGCVLLEANNYDRLIGETYRIALKKKIQTTPVVADPHAATKALIAANQQNNDPINRQNNNWNANVIPASLPQTTMLRKV